MNTVNNNFLVFAFLILVVSFLYFGGEIITGGGIIGRMNGNGWLGINGWLWFLTLAAVVFGVELSWVHFRKKA
jgi:hypothetical protein